MLEIFRKIKKGFQLYFPSHRTIGKAGVNAHIEFPVFISSPQNVIMEEDTRIRRGCDFQNSENEDFFKKNKLYYVSKYLLKSGFNKRFLQ